MIRYCPHGVGTVWYLFGNIVVLNLDGQSNPCSGDMILYQQIGNLGHGNRAPVPVPPQHSRSPGELGGGG